MTIFSAEQKTVAAAPTGASSAGQDRGPGVDPSQKGHPGWIVAGSLVAGGLAAIVLAAAPFVRATESGVTGGILLGLALGWALLAALTLRFTAQPQKWAVVPALFMGLGGFLLVALGSPAQEVLAWVWPPALLVLAVWMVLQTHRQLRSRTGRFLLYPVMGVLALASVGGAFETVGAVGARGPSPAQGQLIDVGGHRLYLSCTGSGSPTVVIEPGAGGMSSDLGWIAPAVARDTRVCVYDRAGRGWSDPANTSQDAEQIAADLHTLLQRGNSPGPYVLAGHSFGGLYTLTFAARYPNEVAGMVLVDSTAPASEPESAHGTRPDSDDTIGRVSALASAAGGLGVGRLLGVTPSHLVSTADEYLRAGASVQHAAALKSFTDKPLVVLTATIGNQPGWDASQEALALLSTNSLHRVIAGASHASFITDPDDGAAAARGILEVVSAVRTATPLP
ncbi:alpha/beta fold hydrolase [Arthrobacter sp. MDT3-24]